MTTPMTKIREEWDNFCKENMDTRKYYADWFINHFQQELSSLEGEMLKMKKQPTRQPIPCPDGVAGCLAYHFEEKLSVEDKKFNDQVDTFINLIRQHKEG